ncbi:MAG: TetR/AcrR family transcriptional regulator [Polyangiales bacterium]
MSPPSHRTAAPKTPSKRGAASKKAPKPRTTYHHGDLARELMSASLQLLTEVGADGLSLREAARRAGVNHRAVYRHYEDKRALLAAIAEAGYYALRDDLQAAVMTLDAPASAEPGPTHARVELLALAEAYLRFARREPARYQVMFGPRLNLDGRFPGLERAIQALIAVLERTLKLAGPTVSGRDRRDAGLSFLSAIHGMSGLVLVNRIRLREDYIHSYVAKLMTPVVDGLLGVLDSPAR